MILAAALLMLGLTILVLGAELLTRGGAALARQMRVPPVVIGLTVVAIGTSTPELAIGIDAAMIGNGPLAVGNIAGTNTVNLLLILGLSALIHPLALRSQTIRMDLPVMILAAFMMLAMSLDGRLSRLDGVVLVGSGIIYTLLVVRSAARESRAFRVEFAKEYYQPKVSHGGGRRIAASGVTLVSGIAVIVLGADIFVDAAVALARMWGVSDAFIGLTVVAMGTSAPELVTTVLSTLKRERDIAIGNLLGSSVYNIFAVLGITCLVPAAGVPVTPELIWVDIPVMALVALVCAPIFLSGREVSRMEAAALVGSYLAYLAYLLITRT
jgi:cation:H+ antiporter